MKTKMCLFSFISFIFFLQIILVSTAAAANKIMPLGDSITEGSSSGVADNQYRVSYRKALYDMLKADGYVVDGELFVGTLTAGASVPDFDPDHDGRGGWTTDQIVNGNPGLGFPPNDKLDQWLLAEEPNVVLLHIGTNDIGGGVGDWNEVETLLGVIDAYESASGKAVWVVLALITDWSCDPLDAPCLANSAQVTSFNFDVRTEVFDPRKAAGVDKIVLVDMQNDAFINYDNVSADGDMWDDVHPFETGYAKMANLWYTGLEDILPQAYAGPDQSLNEFEPVTLDASGSFDPKNGTLTYQWVQTAGTPTVDLSPDAQAQKPTFDAPDVGPTGQTLTFQLTVTDNDELVSTDTVDILVQNIPPQANAGLDQSVNELVTVTLDATGSSGVGLTYQWLQTTGTPVVLSDNQAIQPFFEAPDVGPSGEILTFELKVTDDDGVDSKDTVTTEVSFKDSCPSDPNKTEPGACGCGIADVDTDGDGTLDCIDNCDSDPGKILPGACGCGVADVDTDGDSIFDCADTNGDFDGLSDLEEQGLDGNDPNYDVVYGGGTSGGGGGGGGCFIGTAVNSVAW
ncbi:MAG: PKD domain-containing protein [Nitrospinales bacterium]